MLVLYSEEMLAPCPTLEIISCQLFTVSYPAHSQPCLEAFSSTFMPRMWTHLSWALVHHAVI
jgi:hypothetical protein